MTISIRLLDPPAELDGTGYVFAPATGVPPATIRERGTGVRWAFAGWAARTALYRRA